MGSLVLKDSTKGTRNNCAVISKMFFYFYKHPLFAMEQEGSFCPGFPCHQYSYVQRNPLNLLDHILDQAMTHIQTKNISTEEKNTAVDNKNDHEVENTNEELKIENSKQDNKVEQASCKKILTHINVEENDKEAEIRIDFIGRNFQGEHLDVQVVNGKMLIKAEHENDKFERRFNLPDNSKIDAIESKFKAKDEEKQSLIINIPKDVKIVQVPIAMEE